MSEADTRAEAVQHEGKQFPGISLAEVIQSRRTIHLFKPEPVPLQETIRQAVDMARWAPNHRMTEPWRFYLLGRETAEALARLNADLVAEKRGPEAGRNKLERWMNIPGWLAVTCKQSEDALRAREDYAACCCAIANLQLYLWNEGIGVKWTTGAVTRDARFYELLEIDPELETLVGLLWYGYPADTPSAPPRRPVDDILHVRP